MPTLSEIRAQYPQYKDLSDGALAGALYEKFYSDMPREDFNKKVGFTPKELSRTDRVLQGAGDIIEGGAQSIANMLPTGVANAIGDTFPKWLNEKVGTQVIKPVTVDQMNSDITKREQDYQNRRVDAGQSGFDGYRALGGAAATLPLAAMAPVGGSLMGATALGAVTGAAGSLAQPVIGAENGNFWDKKADQAGVGAGLGAIAGPIGYGIGRAIAPNISQDVKALSDAGVKMTPGQVLGGGAKRIEDAAMSLPLLGDRITGARSGSVESFNKAVANKVLEPIGKTVPDGVSAGHELNTVVKNTMTSEYNRILPNLTINGPDQQFAQELAQIGNSVIKSPSARKEWVDIVNDEIVSRLGSGPVVGKDIKKIESDLRKMAQDRIKPMAHAAEREQGEAFGALLNAFRGLRNRTNPQYGQELNNLDSSYAMFKRMELAGAKSNDGVFTPMNLRTAVSQADRSMNKGAVARGDALMQDISAPAFNVLPSKLPNSGTTDRAMINAGLLGAGGVGAVTGAIPPGAAIAGGLAYGAYNPVIMAAFQKAMTANRPKSIRTLGDLIAGSGGLVGAAGPGLLAQ